jgi:3-dehydroquinate synthase
MNTTTPLQSRVDFGPGIRFKTAKILHQIDAGKKVLLLSQKSLPREWIDEIKTLLEEEFSLVSMELPDGEDAKTLENLNSCWEILQKHEFTRKDCIVAIGGGALTDLAGFCASTYLRGIKIVLLPTTLLAQVDASIGGKTGINLPSGKNLAGAFYFPESVIVDPEFLTTLPERDFKSGMGEIVKYAFIEKTISENTDYKAGPRSLLTALRENMQDDPGVNNPFLAPLVSICIRMKLGVLLKDPFEGRLRRCLNLGHTLGHGLEKVSKYQITHGEAVAIGTVFAFKLAVSRKMIPAEEMEKAVDLMKTLQLPYERPANLDSDKLLQAMAHDKKRTGSHIKYVLPENVCGVVNLDSEISVDELSQALVAI